MELQEIFCIALTQLDRTSPQSPGEFELVIRNHSIYSQRAEHHKQTDIVLLRWYQHRDRPRFNTHDWLELWAKIAKLHKEDTI